MPGTECPDREQLLCFSLGTLDAVSAEAIAEHLSWCPDCNATLDELTGQDDTVLAALREAESHSPFLGEPEYWRAVDQLRGLRLGPPPQAGEASLPEEPTDTTAPTQLGEYRLLGKLGSGGMGRVYKALHTRLDRTVALKLLPKGRLEDQRAVARFEREMRAIGQLDHPNIVRAHDAREIDGQPVLVMEYIDGLDLSTVVERCGRLPIADACELVRQAAIGLQYAHEHGLIHRDIKPSNLMLALGSQPSSGAPRASSPAPILKILDLGLSKVLGGGQSGNEITDSNEGMGTPDYMAPEQISESRAVDIRADIYSLGCTLYKLLVGEAPFAPPRYESRGQKMLGHLSDPPPPILGARPEVPVELAAIVGQMMAKSPARRFANPAEVAQALEGFALAHDVAGLMARARSQPGQPGLDSAQGGSAPPQAPTDPSAAAATPPALRLTQRGAGDLALKQRDQPPLKAQPARRRWRTVASIAAAAALLLAGVVVYLKTGEGTLALTLDHPDCIVTIDGQQVTIEAPQDTISVAIGVHELEVKKDGFRAQTHPFEIRYRGDRTPVSITLVPETPGVGALAQRAPQAAAEPGPLRWIETADPVLGLVLSHDGSTLYAGHGRGEQGDSPVGVYDLTGARPPATIEFKRERILGNPHGNLALSLDGRHLYAVNYYGRYLWRADLQTGKKDKLDLTTDARLINLWASDIGITPDGANVVVPLGGDGRPQDENNDRVAVVDVSQGRFALAAQIPLNDEPHAFNKVLAISPDSKFAYVVTFRRKSEAATLYELALTPPYKVARTLAFPGGELRGIAIAGKTGRLFVADYGHRKIWAVDLKTFKPVAEIAVAGHAPETLAVHEGRGLLVALCPDTRRLFCLNMADGAVLATLANLRKRMSGLALSADGKRLYACNRDAPGGIAIVDVEDLLSRIAFASNRAGESFQIYSMGGAGQEVVRLTQGPWTDRFPRWSPDGRRIAFVSDRQGPPRIWLIGARGEAPSVLEKPDPPMIAAVAAPLDWSPDGTQIAFIGDDRKAICVVDVATGQTQTLLEGPVGEGHAYLTSLCWRAADGMILFGSQVPSAGQTHEVFQLDVKTRGVTQVTSDEGEPFFCAPAASAHGEKIAVVRNPGTTPPRREIFVLHADGTGLRRLDAIHQAVCASPAWFPDSDRLVYSAEVAGNRHLFAIDIAGAQPAQLTGGNHDDVDPHVSGRVIDRVGGEAQASEEAEQTSEKANRP